MSSFLTPRGLRLAFPSLLLPVCLAIAGCESKSGTSDSTGASGSAAMGSQDVAAKLAKADAFDGKVDKVVHKCGPCGLGMDGSEKFALNVEGYTMHFCSAGCRDGYAKDPAKSVMAMTIPEK